MKRTLGPSLLAVCAFTCLGLLINITGQPHAQAGINRSSINPVTHIADSLRSLTVELDAMIKWLSSINDMYVDEAGVPVASKASLDVVRRGWDVHRRMMQQPNGYLQISADIQQLDDRVAAQRELIRELTGTLVERRGLFDAIPSLMPCEAVITSDYGLRVHPILGRHKQHTGVDFGAPTGTPIHAASKGTVVFSGRKSGYGNTVMIDHGYGYQTLYAHSSKLLVAVGDTVERGQPIALVGSTGRSTGPHLHFEVIVDDVKVDPMPFLQWTSPFENHDVLPADRNSGSPMFIAGVLETQPIRGVM